MSSPGSSRPADETGASESLHLDLSNGAEDVARARHEVGRFGVQAGLDHLEVGAVELAVGEACANVVNHAYAGGSGDMAIDARVDGGRLLVSVADRGTGIRRRISQDGAGLGTAILIALCDSVEIGAGLDGAGTRVTMTFGI